MTSSSALPTVHQLLDRVSQLLQRNSQTEAETGTMALQCLDLKGKIEQTKASVVEERMKQLVCADKIAYLKHIAAPRDSVAYSMIATPGTLVPRPRSKCMSTTATPKGVSPISLRTKRNGMFFDQETSEDVAKRATGGDWFGEQP